MQLPPLMEKLRHKTVILYNNIDIVSQTNNIKLFLILFFKKILLKNL